MAYTEEMNCEICGKSFIARTPVAKHCKECKLVAAEIRYQRRLAVSAEDTRQKQWQAERDPDRWLDKMEFILVRDPIPVEEGGFKPGAKMGTLDIKECMKTGALVHGTSFRSVKNKKTYLVRNDLFNMLVLMPVN